MSLVGTGAGGTGGGGAGGGGRDDKFKKKMDDTPFGTDTDTNDDEQLFPDFDSVEEDAAPPVGDAASRSVDDYRGVRRYAAGDGSYRTTYVSCINSRDSPHNNRQIWLGRYYELKAAAMAYDVFTFYNHHDSFVNFPELLQLYAQFIPRRGLRSNGIFLPITASDLERIKHIGLGIIRAFYPDSCAAIHTRRNQKALPAANPALTAQQRQTAAALQAAYHAQIEERTRTLVLAYIANQQPLAQQAPVGAGQAGPSSPQAPENATAPSLPLQAANTDFSSIQIPFVSSQTPHPTTHETRIDFSAIQVPQHHAPIPLASTSGPRVGHVRQASTSPDTLRQTSSHYAESSSTPLQAYSNFFPQNPFAQFVSPSQINPDSSSIFRRHQSSPEFAPAQASHVSRPAPTRAVSLPESPFLRSLGIIPDAAASEHRERPNPLIRSNIERSTEEAGSGKRVSFEEDPYNKAAEARLHAERLRAERLNNQAAAIEGGTSSFPLVQRLRELSRAPYDQLYGGQQNNPHTFLDPSMGSRASPKKQRSSEPLLGAHADLLGSLQPGHGPQRRASAFSSYKATDINVQGGSSSQISSLPDAIPVRAREPAGDSALREEEDQRVVPLRRQTPEELPLFGVYTRRATAAATSAKASSTSIRQQGPSKSNVQASSPTSLHGGLSEQEGNTSSRPISTELTLARGELGPPFVRAPFNVPDLNVRAPEAASEALKVVSTTSAESPQDVPINIRELQRVSTLGPSWQEYEGPSGQQEGEESSSPVPPYNISQPGDKSKQEEDKGKGKEKVED